MTGREGAHFRPDIEGLRGLAILLVVLFHAAPALLRGGYVGVDVFFVISGFLITGLLARELGRRGRIDLGSFYARRIRRLVPAAVLALGATLLLSAWLVPPLELARVAGDGVAAAASVANLRFAFASGDYFSAVETPSPFLHYWSLSVEEQFYLLWPATLILAFALGRGLRGLVVLVGALTIVSLAAAVLVTDVAQGWAFYSLPTRAWQLAVGGLLAVAALERVGGRWRSASLALVAWLGLTAVLLAGMTLDDAIAYPGLWALLPTLGAVALIAGGDRSWGPGRILRTRPMRFLGRISYALYLWHWPLLVLPTIALGELSLVQRAALLALAVLVATVSTIMVEEPLRRGSVGASGRRQLVVIGSLGLALALSVGTGLGAVDRATQEASAASGGTAAAHGPEDGRGRDGPGRGGRRQGGGPADAVMETGRGIEVDDEATIDQAITPQTSGSKPPKVVPTRDPPSRAGSSRRKPARSTRVKPEPPVIALPATVKPSVWEASADEESLRDNGCLQAEEVTQPRSCRYGKAGSRTVVALVGDSHASHWFPALRRVAVSRNWRLETFVKVSCPFTDIPVRNLQLKRAYRECARFNENVAVALGRLRPDLVITSLSRWQHPTRAEDESPTAQGAGIARMLERVPGRKVVIADVPYPGRDVPACLSKHPKDVRECAVPAYGRVSGGSPARERTAAKRSGGAFVDFARVICGGSGACPVVSHDRIVFRDSHHMTATYSRWLAPALERALVKVLRQRR